MTDVPMKESIDIMTRRMASVPAGGMRGVWLYGSVTLDDFRLGWSDIDFLALTESPLSEEEAGNLLELRARLSEEFPGNPYFPLFEGVILSGEEYFSGNIRRAVYWGTSGQRITERYRPDVFSRYELAANGVRVFGSGSEPVFEFPTREEIVSAVRAHLEGIRRCAVKTDYSLYSCGWLLDTARCVYTLRTGGVISKTEAGRRALKDGLFPCPEQLERTLAVRMSPLEYVGSSETKRWLESLGPTVQSYADVLETELKRLG